MFSIEQIYFQNNLKQIIIIVQKHQHLELFLLENVFGDDFCCLDSANKTVKEQRSIIPVPYLQTQMMERFYHSMGSQFGSYIMTKNVPPAILKEQSKPLLKTGVLHVLCLMTFSLCYVLSRDLAQFVEQGARVIVKCLQFL